MQVTVREWVLEASTLVSLCMLAVWLWFLVPRVCTSRFYADDTTRGIIGIAAFVIGGLMRGVWVSGLLWSFSHHEDVDKVAALWPIDLIGGIVTVAGGLCVIREFAPDGYGTRLAIIAAFASAAALLIIHVL